MKNFFNPDVDCSTTMRTRFGSLLGTLLLLLSTIFVSGCDYGVGGPALGDVGATPGGAQDIGYARSIIEAGEVPQAEYIMPEGVYSEHDIATPAGECQNLLCLALGYGFATPIDDTTENLFLHLGMSSTINAATFHRDHLQLAVVVDKSGSMGSGSLAAVKSALRSLIEKLDAEDEVALVKFNDGSDVVMQSRKMDAAGKEEFAKQIEKLEADGGTDIEAGMIDGYRQIAPLATRPNTSKRLMLFTDAMPNVGATDQESFKGITQQYADEGIGLTAFGVGVDFGQELVYYISNLKGANFFYLESEEKIRTVFNDEFDYLVTPIAYNLKIRVPTPAGATLDTVYGLPGWKPGDVDALLDIPTVFLSSRRGAIMLRYRYHGGGGMYSINTGDPVANGSISYVDTKGNQITSARVVNHQGPLVGNGSTYFSHEGTRLGVALTNVYIALHDACALYYADRRSDALRLLDRGIVTIENELPSLGGTGLEEKLELMKKLKANIEAGG